MTAKIKGLDNKIKNRKKKLLQLKKMKEQATSSSTAPPNPISSIDFSGDVGSIVSALGHMVASLHAKLLASLPSEQTFHDAQHTGEKTKEEAPEEEAPGQAQPQNITTKVAEMELERMERLLIICNDGRDLQEEMIHCWMSKAGPEGDSEVKTMVTQQLNEWEEMTKWRMYAKDLTLSTAYEEIKTLKEVIATMQVMQVPSGEKAPDAAIQAAADESREKQCTCTATQGHIEALKLQIREINANAESEALRATECTCTATQGHIEELKLQIRELKANAESEAL
eukprot:GHVS01014586.1.p1 GENE.GHVS01014586.1~~GHVS01014586.1.p1  ORF type:complete len:283 (-),score=51.40 GHVS01014586.1:6-854(-)